MGLQVWDLSHRHSVFTNEKGIPNNNNNKRQNEASTKIAYLMSETAWIADTLAGSCNQMIRLDQGSLKKNGRLK